MTKRKGPQDISDGDLDQAQGGGLLAPAVQEARLAAKRNQSLGTIEDGTSNTLATDGDGETEHSITLENATVASIKHVR